MKLSIADNREEAVWLTLNGQITQRELPTTHDPLLDLLGPDVYRRQIRLDLSEASYLDSSGVNWLLTCHKRTKQAGGRLKIIKPHPVVANVLRVLKLEKVFDMDDSEPGVVA